MGKHKNHITNSEEYQKYLEGSMTSKERHNFEKRLLDDEFESEALEGFYEVESEELSQDLTLLSQKLKAKSERSYSFMYWRVAASILILALFSFAIYFLIEVNTSPEVAQSKEKAEEEKAMIPQENREVLDDSIAEEPEPIIAYKQESTKVKDDAHMPPQVKEKVVFDEEVVVELDLAEDDENEMVVEIAEVQAAEPADLPTIASNEAPVDIDPQKRTKSTVAKQAVPPTAMEQGRYSTRIDNIRTVTGKIVSDEDNTPVPGVNVIVKGSGQATVSDMDGNYKIDVPEDEEATLVYSYIGLTSEEIQVKDQDSINVAMQADIKQLTETVVTAKGYEIKTKDYPYSDSPPMPAIGYENWNDYIKENLLYPESGLEEKIKGIVRLKFSVTIDGKISNLEIIKSLGEDFDQEAIRLVKEGPYWEPAIENDSAVVREVKLKIRFRPPE